MFFKRLQFWCIDNDSLFLKGPLLCRSIFKGITNKIKIIACVVVKIIWWFTWRTKVEERNFNFSLVSASSWASTVFFPSLEGCLRTRRTETSIKTSFFPTRFPPKMNIGTFQCRWLCHPRPWSNDFYCKVHLFKFHVPIKRKYVCDFCKISSQIPFCRDHWIDNQ